VEQKHLKGKDLRDGETKSYVFCQKLIQKETQKPKNIDKIRKNNKKDVKKDVNKYNHSKKKNDEVRKSNESD
jgi:hypothetical protein